MKIINKNIIWFTCFLIYFFPQNLIFAQQEKYSFQHLTIEEGLSQSTIFCIHQDKKGFMWFGTVDGLNRYDGYEFKIYTGNSTDSTAISGNGITEIFEDENGYLWIGTTDGVLNKFDRKTEVFSHYSFKSVKSKVSEIKNRYFSFPLSYSRNNAYTITSIISADSNHLWIGTWGNGLIYFDKSTGDQNYFQSDSLRNSISYDRVTSLLKDSDENIWIGTFGGGLNRMIVNSMDADFDAVEFINYKSDSLYDSSLSDDKIISIYEDKNNCLWIGTFFGGLNLLTKDQKFKPAESAAFKIFMHDDLNNGSISNNTIMSITEDNLGDLWIGTFGGGLNKFDHSTETFSNYKHDPFNENSLADNDVLSIYTDRTGILWVGTHLGKGLSKLVRNSIKFGLIKKERGNSNSLNDDVVWSIYEEDNSGILWVGTYRGGINKIDRKKNRFTFYTNNPSDSNSIGDNHVRVIAEGSNNNLWLGTYSNGLNNFDKSTGIFTRFINDPNDPSSISGNQIQSIYIDADSICWIGTFGGGLNKFDLKKYDGSDKIEFTKFVHDPSNNSTISDDRVYTIFEDKDGLLWIGTYGGGLNKFDKLTETFSHYISNPDDYSTLSNNKVISIFEDSGGTLWIGTSGGGLNKFNKQSEEFERMTITNGIYSQVIYGILEDDKKNLWMSADNGLIKFNTITSNVTYFELTDGLQSMEFNGGAYFKNKKGEMFFGGISGLNYFFPDSVRSNDQIPPIVISELKIFDETVKGEVTEIVLDYNQNYFTFEFSALDYTNPGDNQYAYYLEGLENEWHLTDALLRRANYTNLQPGDYTFRVKGSNNDGLWNQEGLAISVAILPPFWKTWWFIFISIVSIGGLVSFLISMRVKHLLAMEKLKVRLAADLHDNVGAGLTEISILSELAAKDIGSISKSTSKKLDNISETARHLVDSMSDIVWFVNPNRDSLHDLIIRLKDSFSDLLNVMGVSFKTDNIDNIVDIKLPMEFRQNLFLIFKEAINNSIKHSKCERINLETKLEKNMLSISLKDDGIGMEKVDYRKGNGLRNIKNRASAINGNLEIITKKEKGTNIIFTGKISSFNRFKLIFDRE